MRFEKLLWSVVALGTLTSVAVAEPLRTIYTKENRFPGAMGVELSLNGVYTGIDNDEPMEDGSRYEIGPAVRFGVTDRIALSLYVPVAGYDFGDDIDESGIGDIHAGGQFLFFEDIFEYAWIVPYVDVRFASGDEDKGLGSGETGAQFGISVGTTIMDCLQFAADASYEINSIYAARDDDALVGALSIVWDLNEMPRVYGGVTSSLFAEIQVRDDSPDIDDDYWTRGHGGLSFRANDLFTISGFAGASSSTAMDYYAGGRMIFSF